MPKPIIAVPADIRHFTGADWHAAQNDVPDGACARIFFDRLTRSSGGTMARRRSDAEACTPAGSCRSWHVTQR